MTNEEWRPVPGADGYFASVNGEVRGPRGALKPSPMKNGYLGIKIRGKGTTAHAAVAAAFHGARPTPEHEVNHKNGKKTDNRPENLEWLTASENMRHAVGILGVKFGGHLRLPPAPPSPEPLSRWQSVVVLDAHGQVMHRVDLFVPADSSGARCDQHAAMIDGDRALMTATQIGAKVRGWIAKRPSTALIADIRRDDYAAAVSARRSAPGDSSTTMCSPGASARTRN